MARCRADGGLEGPVRTPRGQAFDDGLPDVLDGDRPPLLDDLAGYALAYLDGTLADVALRQPMCGGDDELLALLEDPAMKELKQNKSFQRLMNDKAFQKAVNDKQLSAIVHNPSFRAAINDPQLRKRLSTLDLEEISKVVDVQ